MPIIAQDEEHVIETRVGLCGMIAFCVVDKRTWKDT